MKISSLLGHICIALYVLSLIGMSIGCDDSEEVFCCNCSVKGESCSTSANNLRNDDGSPLGENCQEVCEDHSAVFFTCTGTVKGEECD